MSDLNAMVKCAVCGTVMKRTENLVANEYLCAPCAEAVEDVLAATTNLDSTIRDVLKQAKVLRDEGYF